MKSFTVFAAAGSLLASSFANAQPLGNPAIRSPFDAGRAAVSQKNAINQRIYAINNYGDHLIAGTATNEEQGACQRSLADLQDFVARTSGESAFSSVTAGGDKILGAKVAAELQNMDANPCPTIDDFRDFGKNIFRATPAEMATWNAQNAGMMRRMTNVARYNSDYVAGRSTRQEWAVCQGSLNDMQNFRRQASQQPMDRALLRRLNAAVQNGAAFSCPAP